MIAQTTSNSPVANTSYKVVLPFYVYAAVAFLVATILLLSSTKAFHIHYFHPQLLAITHIMALGWGTMIILGASHQLIPVLIESGLYSNKLAYASFVLTGIGVPLLAYAFYTFDMGDPAKWGGRFVVIGILTYLINVAKSMARSKTENVHATFVFTATVWLFITVLLGLVQVYNFTAPLLQEDSLHYLALHAHSGILGWFLLLIIGVGSRLIPMFLISKYTNDRLLWLVYYLINISLLSFVMIFYFPSEKNLIFLPIAGVILSISLFVYYCYKAYQQRIRRQVDEQMKLSLLSIVMLLLPMLLLVAVVSFIINSDTENIVLINVYGFLIFFGWLTAIILGMTFKTLPFIVWNKVYHVQATQGQTPNPKDLFDDKIFKIMSIAFIAGLLLFVAGILAAIALMLQAGAILLLVTAILYNFNVLKVVFHKIPKL
ncbi:MAG: cytochrome c oxidase subunit I [Chitinophagaceae bacterium]|nr:cytochrome c oxidase subunit I [Chitinophagaceae bacterium]